MLIRKRSERDSHAQRARFFSYKWRSHAYESWRQLWEFYAWNKLPIENERAARMQREERDSGHPLFVRIVIVMSRIHSSYATYVAFSRLDSREETVLRSQLASSCVLVNGIWMHGKDASRYETKLEILLYNNNVARRRSCQCLRRCLEETRGQDQVSKSEGHTQLWYIRGTRGLLVTYAARDRYNPEMKSLAHFRLTCTKVLHNALPIKDY